MYSFTVQERALLLFIISSLVLGLGILHFRKSNVPTSQPQLDLNKDVEQIKEEIKRSKQVNINTAGIEELTRLPGVGKIIAERIVEYRKTHNSFISKEEIKKVKGIGDNKFERMEEFILLE